MLNLNSKTIKRFFTQGLLSLMVLSTAAWILNRLPLGLRLNRPLLVKTVIVSGFSLLLLNLNQVKDLFFRTFDTPKKRGRFVWLGLANLALTLIFIIIYALFQYGSPLIFEKQHEVSEANQTMWLVNEQVVRQEFVAAQDKLGTIGIEFGVKEVRLGIKNGEVVELEAFEVGEEELITAVEDDVEIELPETVKEVEQEVIEPVKLEFRIKEKSADEWLAVNQYYFNELKPFGHYPLGFPVIDDSAGKTYVFELEAENAAAELLKEEVDFKEVALLSADGQEIEPKLAAFVRVNNQGQVSFYERFVYGREELAQDFGLVLNNFQSKVVNATISIEFTPILILHLLLSFSLIVSAFNKNRFAQLVKYIFLSSLFLACSISLLNSSVPFLNEALTKNYITFMAVISAVLLALVHKDKQRQVSTQCKNQLLKIFNSKPMSLFGFFIILGFFLYLRSLSLNNSPLEMAHYDKARSNFPYAVNAFQQQDFFYFRNYYYHGIESDQSLAYPRLPFYEWSFYPLLYFSNFFSFEILMKFYLILIDVVILLVFYKIAVKVFGGLIGFSTTLLLAVNTYFQYHFLPPTLDRPALLLFLISVLLNLQKKPNLGYLTAGFSGLIKESFFLISLPMHFGLVVFNQDSLKNKVIEILKLCLYSLIPFILFKLFGSRISTADYPLLLFILFWGLILVLFLLANKISSLFKKIFINNFSKRKLFRWFYLLPLVLIISGSYYLFNRAQRFASGFITSPELIFRWRMYYSILKQQEFYLPNLFWLLSLLGIIFSFKIRSRERRVFLALTLSTLVYLIIASKSIFFHSYYRHMFVIFMIFLLGFILLKIKKLFTSNNRYLISSGLILFLSSLILVNTVDMSVSRIQRSRGSDNTTGYRELASYIQTNSATQEKIFTEGPEAWLGAGIYSLRSPANYGDKELVRKEIQNNGFIQTMQKYYVNKYVSKGPANFTNILNLFTDVYKTTNITRTENILLRIKDENWAKYPPGRRHDLRAEYRITESLKDENEALLIFNPSQYFELKQVIGDFYIYQLVDDD